MRELKFRVWDNKNKQMFVPLYICGLTGKQIIPASNDSSDCYSDSVVMQYTGLNDKNKNEIFEGDIVLVDGAPYSVEWREAGHWFIDPKNHQAFMFRPEVYSLEIIGNIHENRGLLKEKGK